MPAPRVVAVPDVVRPRFLRSHGLLLVALGAVSAPFVIGLASLLGRLESRARPWGDQALMDLSVRAVGDEPVLLGPYSRFGWRHPGPLYFHLLAAPYRVLGGSYAALSVGAVLITGAAAIGIVLVSARRGGQGLGAWAAAVVLVFLGSAGAVAADPWNPSVTMLPFALAVMLAWTLACGDLWALPVLAFVATFVVQTHVSYAAPVGAVTVVALAAVMWDARSLRREPERWPERRRAVTRCLLITAGVLFVLWLAPVIDQLTNDPGNFQVMGAFFTSASSDQTIAAGLERTAQYAGAIPARLIDGSVLFDSSRRSAVSWPIIVSLVGLGAAAAVALRRRARPLALGVALVAVVLAATVMALSRVVGDLEEYLVDWIAVIGVPLWIVVGAAVPLCVRAPSPAGRAVPPRTGAKAGPTIVTAIAAIVITIGGLGVLVAEAAPAFHLGAPNPTTVSVTAMTDAVRRELPHSDVPRGDAPRGEVPIVIRVRGRRLTPWAAGILDGLRADGRDAKVLRAAHGNVSFWPWELTRRVGRHAVVVTLARARPGRPADAVIDGVAIDVTRNGSPPRTTPGSEPGGQ